MEALNELNQRYNDSRREMVYVHLLKHH